MNLDFFELLYSDQEFCRAIGKTTLAAGRFESNLRAYLRLNGIEVTARDATLGALISALSKHRLLSTNGIQVLRDLKLQRNYLTHSLFDLFSGRIEETVLSRTELVPLDVEGFTEKALQLEENLTGLSAIAEKRIADLVMRHSPPVVTDDCLFRP